MTHSIAKTVFVGLVTFAVNALAQADSASQAKTIASWAPPSGSRIRLTSPVLEKRQTGTLIFADDDSVVVRLAKFSSPRAVRTRDVTRLEVSRGTHTSKGKGFLMGFAIAGGLTFAIASAAWNESRAGFVDFGRWGDATIAGTCIGLIGGVIGGNLGAHPRESWEQVKIPGT